MENEPEVTRAQMDETRASLSEKLETLEQQVVDSVQGATAAVTETVETVKVAVAGTVENVRDTFDLPLQVRRHPWAAVGGSIALGYLGGYLVFRNRVARPAAPQWKSGESRASLRPAPRQNGFGNGYRAVDQAPSMSGRDAARQPSEPGWVEGITHHYREEISKLKGLAIGTAMSVARDLVTEAVSDQLRPQLAALMDSITAKMGGEPMPAQPKVDDAMEATDEKLNRDARETGGPRGTSARHTQTAVGSVS